MQDHPNPNPIGTPAAEALRREVYWAPSPTRSIGSRYHGVPMSPIAARWNALAGTLRWEYGEVFPPEPLLRAGGGMRVRIKRMVWRITRPMSRRYDRIAGDLAELGFETAQFAAGSTTGRPEPGPTADHARLAALEAEVASLREELRRARGDRRGSADPPPAE